MVILIPRKAVLFFKCDQMFQRTHDIVITALIRKNDDANMTYESDALTTSMRIKSPATLVLV